MGVNGIVVVVMYGGFCEETDGGNVITDVSELQGGKKTLHKGEFKKQRQHHLSCETIVRENKIKAFLH